MRQFRTSLSLAIAATLGAGLLVGCDRGADAADAGAPPVADAPAATTPDPSAGAGYDSPAGDTGDTGDAASGTWPAANAAAMLMPGPDVAIDGTLNFDIADGGVRITGTLTGFAPGATHALHVHETGRCEPPKFESAGPHLNPEGAPHGHPDHGPHHAGDVPNQTADADGSVAVDQVVAGLTIGDGGPTDVVGKAVVVHASADDYESQPAGNAGARIACGVISLMTAPPAAGAADA
ncbi:superoxide dismutase family protein [Arenimonas composti]|nr:superoxide dismutase family protein [Arenimonas composti]